MFRFTQEPSSGSQSQCLVKLQVWFHCACRYERCQCYGGIFRAVVRVCTRSVRKVSDRIFLCEHLMDYNLARLHEPTLNLSAHA